MLTNLVKSCNVPNLQRIIAGTWLVQIKSEETGPPAPTATIRILQIGKNDEKRLHLIFIRLGNIDDDAFRTRSLARSPNTHLR